MQVQEGDTFKHRITGELYKVKAIINGKFILESLDTPHKLWIGDEDVGLFFQVGEGRNQF